MSPLLEAIMVEFGPSVGNVRAGKAAEARIVEHIAKLFDGAAAALVRHREERELEVDVTAYLLGYIRGGLQHLIGDQVELACAPETWADLAKNPPVWIRGAAHAAARARRSGRDSQQLAPVRRRPALQRRRRGGAALPALLAGAQATPEALAEPRPGGREGGTMKAPASSDELVLDTLLADLRGLEELARTTAEVQGWCEVATNLVDQLTEILDGAELARLRERLLFPEQGSFLRSVP